MMHQLSNLSSPLVNSLDKDFDRIPRNISSETSRDEEKDRESSTKYNGGLDGPLKNWEQNLLFRTEVL